MNIYSSSKPMPYVYKLVHKETGQFYIGYRCANKVPSSDDIGTFYFSSSEEVHKLGFENFNIHILAEFFQSEHAREFESEMIRANWKSPLKLNRNISGARFCAKKGHAVTLETRSKISDTLKGHICSLETRQKLSENNKGFTHTSETRSKMSSTRKGVSKSQSHVAAIARAKDSDETRARYKKSWANRRIQKLIDAWESRSHITKLKTKTQV